MSPEIVKNTQNMLSILPLVHYVFLGKETTLLIEENLLSNYISCTSIQGSKMRVFAWCFCIKKCL